MWLYVTREARVRQDPRTVVPMHLRESPPLVGRERSELPAWAALPALLAPVAMIGGWTLAAARQSSFDPVLETISALAASTASDPWIMTAGLALTGVAHVGAAVALRGLPSPARAVHALGGLATAVVAALPVDVLPSAHGIAAGIGFGALALWPALASAGARSPSGRGLSRSVALGTSAVLTGLVLVFVAELQGLTPDAGAATGLAERAAAGAQSLTPLLVMAAIRRGRAGR